MARVVRLVVAPLSVILLLVTLVTLRAAGGDSAVTKAVKAGDLTAVKKLLAARADVNAPSGDGSTPLLWAVHDSDIEVVRLLLGAGAKVDAVNNYGVTPLLDASRTGDAEMMEVLLKAGADPKRSHPEGETPLMAASRSGNPAAVRMLLDRGVDVNSADVFQNQTALMWAAAEGHVEVAEVLLKAGADPNKKARVSTLTDRKNADHPTGGFTALMWAARNGDDAMIRTLVKGGADMNLKNGDNGSATMVAIYNDRFDAAATLAELGSDVNEGSLYTAVEMRESTTDQFAFDGSRLRPNHSNQRTALDMIKLLLEKGADPNKNFTGQFHSATMPNGDRFDNTPFFRAAITADVEALKLLIAHGANLEQSPAAAPTAAAAAPGDDDAAAGPRGRGNANAGRTAAMVSMNGGRGPAMTGGPGYIRDGAAPYREPGSRKPLDAFTLLMKSGANPNAKAPDGSSLLHQAAQAANLDMIKVLAEAKVDFNQTNKDGFTALDVAEGKRAEGAARGRGAAAPPAAGGRGRGARGGATQQDVAKLLRELMGLPPAPPAPPAAAPTGIPEAPGGGVQ